jgi:hypothetical protein
MLACRPVSSVKITGEVFAAIFAQDSWHFNLAFTIAVYNLHQNIKV